MSDQAFMMSIDKLPLMNHHIVRIHISEVSRKHFISNHMPKTTEGLLLDKTDKILRILAAIATKGLKQRDQIALLNQAGLQPKDIAELLRTSSNTVRVELVAIRKKRGSKKGRTRGQETRGE
jgi:DNA-binding NarL/FixJ family response regulator